MKDSLKDSKAPTPPAASLPEDKVVIVPPYNMQQYDHQLASFYQQCKAKEDDTLKAAAEYFLDQPYLFEALGEGETGKYAQEPLYRTDKFDCVTYVDTILSLFKSKNLEEFKTNIVRIRYLGAISSYIYRTDWFTDLEWIPNARNLGWIRDITWKIMGQNHQSMALIASTVIDKPNWYKVKPYKAMHLFETREAQAEQLLQQLQSEGQRFQPQLSELSYLPLNALFSDQDHPNTYFFDQIPSGCVVAVVRPNWQIKDHFPGFPQGYGSHLNVSHLGIAIRTQEGLMFYHASSLDHKVMYQPLIEYLQKHMENPTVKGIHVEKII